MIAISTVLAGQNASRTLPSAVGCAGSVAAGEKAVTGLDPGTFST